jgi:hypothetical protein
MATAANACRGRIFKNAMEQVQCNDTNERPIITKDLPSLLYSYDQFNTVRNAAAIEYDGKIKLEKEKGVAAYNVIYNEAVKKLNNSITSIWPQSQTEKDALRQEADRASSAICKRDGLWLSTSMVVNMKCDNAARMSILERRVPAATNALNEFFDSKIKGATAYDRFVLPAIQTARVDFKNSIQPAKAAFISEVQAALQADAAATARQRQEISDLLLALVQTTIAVAGAVADVRTIQYCNTHGC